MRYLFPPSTASAAAGCDTFKLPAIHRTYIPYSCLPPPTRSVWLIPVTYSPYKLPPSHYQLKRQRGALLTNRRYEQGVDYRSYDVHTATIERRYHATSRCHLPHYATYLLRHLLSSTISCDAARTCMRDYSVPRWRKPPDVTAGGCSGQDAGQPYRRAPPFTAF